MHRRLLHDDYLGVAEPLNEPGLDGNGLIVRGKHLLLFDTVQNSAAFHRDLAMRTFAKPLLTFASNSLDYATYSARYLTQYSGLARPLPPNVHLLTFAYWRNVSATMIQALVRFEHFYQKGEDAKLSQPATFNLQGLFNKVQVQAYDTLTLGANQKASDAQRLKWNVQSERLDLNELFGSRKARRSKPLMYAPQQEHVDDDWQITLQPMEIRTLLLNITVA